MITFKESKIPFKIMAKSDRYIVASRKFNMSSDTVLLKHLVKTGAFMSFNSAYKYHKNNPVYTIVDLLENKRSSTDRLFNDYDFFSKEDCERVIEDLESGKIVLRNEIELNVVYDKKTAK